jgi:hypothetical protein
VSGEPGIDRAALDDLTDRLRGLKGMAEELGHIAREGIAVMDAFVVDDHPDLDDLGHELRNVYGSAFDDPA